jgi:hypothetical protein
MPAIVPRSKVAVWGDAPDEKEGSIKRVGSVSLSSMFDFTFVIVERISAVELEVKVLVEPVVLSALSAATVNS